MPIEKVRISVSIEWIVGSVAVKKDSSVAMREEREAVAAMSRMFGADSRI